MKKFLFACLLFCSPAFAGDVPSPPANVNLQTNDTTRWGCTTSTLSSTSTGSSGCSAGSVVASDDSPSTYWLIKFNLPTAPSRPAVLNNAWVQVRSRGTKTSQVYRIKNSWTTASYSGVLGGNGLQIGTDVDSDPITTFLGKDADDPHLFFVTQDVIDMYAGTKSNNGWLVKNWNQTGRSEVYCHSVGTGFRLPDMGIVWVYPQADPNFNGTAGYQITDMNGVVSAFGANYDSDADLDYDGDVDEDDRDLMFGVLDSEMGDVNGDGGFDSDDLVELFIAGKYNTGNPAVYTEGDFTGDGVFDSGDLVEAFAAGTYEGGAAAAQAAWEDLNE